jgi:hypothetical protein
VEIQRSVCASIDIKATEAKEAEAVASTVVVVVAVVKIKVVQVWVESDEDYTIVPSQSETHSERTSACNG